MKKADTYKNGQKISEQNGDILTFFYKSGKKKAEGKCINELFEGQWLFYDENGQLSQEGFFLENKKDGEWKRYNENGEIEYHAEFKNGKLITQRNA